MTISVIIPSHNNGGLLGQCLKALAGSTRQPDEIIVVDDASTDDSIRAVPDFGARVLRIDPPSKGPAFARNRGAEIATGDIVFFIDADTAIHPDGLDIALRAFESDPTPAACFGSYDDHPADEGLVSQYKNLLHHYVHQTSNKEANTFWAGCGAIRRDVFMAVGGFNETYRRPSIEDIELGYRLRKAGHRIILVKEMQCTHLKRWTPASLIKTDFFCRALPWTSLIVRKRRLHADLNLRIGSRLSVAGVWLLVLFLLACPILPWMLLPASAVILLLIFLNLGLYRLFRKKRGLAFALAAIPWHWLYFLYCGLGFILGSADTLLRQGRNEEENGEKRWIR